MYLDSIILDKIKLNGKLIPLQFSILKKIKQNNFVFVFDEVGCGKTIEAGIVVWDTVKQNEKNILIVAPSNLVFNWYNEMLSKFGIDFKIIGGTSDSIDLYFKTNSSYYDYNNDNIKNLSNMCIVSYDSRNIENSNAALDRLKNFNISWDLIVLDEGHESKNDSSNRYQTLSYFSAKKVVFLSATPIKNLQEDFNSEVALVSNMLKNSDIEMKFTINEFSPENAISFSLNYPISRNFKEVLVGLNNFKQRNINDIDYKIESNIVEKINERYSGMEFDAKRGCIFLFNRIFSQDDKMLEVYKSYKKSKYDKKDYDNIKTFDSKISRLVDKIDEISRNCINDRVVIFCNHREVVDYLKKMLCAKYGDRVVEAIHGESYSKDERKNRIFLLDKNDKEMNYKKILILSHNVASVGINLSKFNHIFNYELPYTPADLEQRFGRIDRITNTSEVLNMYIFSDSNNQFDNIYFNRLIKKMMLEVLPLLPSKNILFLSNRTKDVYVNTIKSLLSIQSKLKDVYDKTILDNEELRSEILAQLDVSISVSNKNVRIYDFKHQKDIELDELKEELNNVINTIFTNIGISNINDIDTIIQEYVNSMNNTVSYIVDNQRKNLKFRDLFEMINNISYEVFKEEINEIDKIINLTIQELHKKYEDINNKEKFLDFIIEEIQKQRINENMIFSVIYAIWSCLAKKNTDLSFEAFVQIYNDRSC